MSQNRVDLNADVGESFGVYVLGHDAALMPHLTSANVACGFHAGDPMVMRQTVALAVRHGVAVGAHPAFPDLAGFGRREMRLPPADVEAMVVYQIAALAGIAKAEGTRLKHVKPHGALYNMAAVDRTLADAIAAAIGAVDRSLVLVGLSGSALIDAGRGAGLATASEVFADRAYLADGTLLSRTMPGAVIHDEAAVIERAVTMARLQSITAVDGSQVSLHVDTICLHGDTPGAPALARGIRTALTDAGIAVLPMAAERT